MWLNGTVCLYSNAMWVNGIQLERMEQTRESFQKFFRYFRELSQVVQKNPPKKFPGTFPNFSGNFPQCNTAYRKYVSLYSNSSIENVHCRIVQMTKSNRKGWRQVWPKICITIFLDWNLIFLKDLFALITEIFVFILGSIWFQRYELPKLEKMWFWVIFETLGAHSSGTRCRTRKIRISP